MARKRSRDQGVETPDDAGAKTGDSHRSLFRDRATIVLIVVVALGVYANSTTNGFLYDDDLIIRDDPRTRDPARWREIFTRGYWYRRSTDPIYRPVPLLTYLANHMITGPSPAGYRLVNLALHAGVSLMVYAIALQVLRRRWPAVAAALLFAVHPIHGEVVVINIGRADLLCALLYLLAVWQFLREPTSFPSRFTPRFARVLVLFAVALLTKEFAVTFLGAAILADAWRRWQASDSARVTPWRVFWFDRLTRRYLPLVGVLVLSLLVRYQALGLLARPRNVIGGGIENPLDTADLLGRLLTPFALLGKYLNLVVWPDPLCYDYSYNAVPIATGLTDVRVLVGLAWTAALVAAAIVSWRRDKRFLWCIAFFVVTYSIASNSVVLIGTLFAERLVYLPSAAWCWIVAMALALGPARLEAAGVGRRVSWGLVTGILGIALIGYGAKTVVRNRRVFLNNETLYADGVRVNPQSGRCQSFAARRYIHRGDHKTAIRYLRAALDIDDTAWYDYLLIGQEYALGGQVDLGLKHLHRAYEMSTGRYRFEPAFLLGQVYVRTQRPTDAIDWLEEAIRLKPSHALCAANLAYALARADPPRRDPARAIEYIDLALVTAPTDLTVLEMAYGVYTSCRRLQRAAAVVRRALQVIPQTHPVHKLWLKRRK